jgi:hypothetical protein
MDNGSPFSGVSVSDALWGSTVATTTSDSDGDFSQTSLTLGKHSLTYSKSGYFDTNVTGLLETNGQTLDLEAVRLLPDSCTSGTMSGTITNAVTGDNMSNVSLSVRNGIFENLSPTDTQGFYVFGSTDSNGAWSLTKDVGSYTIKVVKSGYYTNNFNAHSCDNQTDQDYQMSELLNEGEMRIMLRWRKTDPVTATDLDSHLQIPDNANSTHHIMYKNAYRTYYYATDNSTCPSCSSDQLSDNVTIDIDDKSPPGGETITISKVRSGTYSFSVHNLTDSDNRSITNLRQSRAKVKVFYCPVGTDCNCNACPAAGNLIKKKFHVPNKKGTLWRVFTFNSSDSGDGFTKVKDMDYVLDSVDVY